MNEIEIVLLPGRLLWRYRLNRGLHRGCGCWFDAERVAPPSGVLDQRVRVEMALARRDGSISWILGERASA